MTARAARFVATVTSHGCATPDQALRALEIAQGIGLDMRAQLASVRTPAARQRIMVAGNRRLTAQICALMGEREDGGELMVRPECEDCGEEVPKGRRRIRAKCGALCCMYCYHHVHGWQCGRTGERREHGGSRWERMRKSAADAAPKGTAL